MLDAVAQYHQGTITLSFIVPVIVIILLVNFVAMGDKPAAGTEAFKPEAVRSLLRSLAVSVLDQARDAESLRAQWLELEREDRADIAVICHAASCARRVQAQAWARRILKPAFESAAVLEPEQREDLAHALWSVVEGIEPDLLPLIEPLE